MKAECLTITHAQRYQPWTVPYAAGIDVAAASIVPHILGSHCALHAAKSLGKIAAVFEELDHSRSVGVAGASEPMTDEQLRILRAMAADLMTTALRFANLYGFDLASALIERTEEKNNIQYPEGDV